MAQIKLFGEQALDLVKNLPKETIGLRDKPIRAKGKKKATITLKNGVYSNDLFKEYKNGVGIGEPYAKKGDREISVDFEGHNEGSYCHYNNEKEALEHLKSLEKQYGEIYKIDIVDVENIRYNSLLNKWKDFIVNLCKERGQEIDVVWFNTSAPLDCEIEVRLAGHRCWNSCISFRFQDKDLRACDSGFLGGTHFVGGFGCFEKKTDEETGKIITELLERCFNKECDKDYVSFWKKDKLDEPITHREIKVDEKGWLIK